MTASKYFRGTLGSPEREHSVKQMIGRVVDTIAGWGEKDAYFATDEDAAAFHAELTDILLKQRAAFNSPVWFNVGIDEHPQCSACFINSVADTMDSILTLAHTEGMLFKYGSGTGSNLSTLRSRTEGLKGGGSASGPVSFMKGFDAFAGVIKSGGKTRRAAKMVILNVGHPDIEEFIDCKMLEEKKAWALIDAGYDGNFNGGEAYESVFFQNSNNSVRVTDEFMEAVEHDADWTTHAVVTGAPMETVKARYLLNKMAEAAWVCGDPGIQYHDNINRWHTSANTAPINASNPCSEYMYLDDSACNLASLNLMKFVKDDGEFDIEAYKHAVRIVLTAQEILVDNASYPTERIAENSHAFRPLGLGYANLGALLMNRGLAYDSDEGRAYAAAITAIMQGEAELQSARISRDQGGAVRRLRGQPRAVPQGHEPAPRRGLPARPAVGPGRPARRGDDHLGRGAGARQGGRLPERAGIGPGPHRHHRLPDGLRHDRRRARYRPGQVQAAGRRRLPEDRQPDGAARPARAGLRRQADRGDRRLHRRARHDRGRAAPQGGAPVASSTAPSSRPTAHAASTTTATSR